MFRCSIWPDWLLDANWPESASWLPIRREIVGGRPCLVAAAAVPAQLLTQAVDELGQAVPGLDLGVAGAGLGDGQRVLVALARHRVAGAALDVVADRLDGGGQVEARLTARRVEAQGGAERRLGAGEVVVGRSRHAEVERRHPTLHHVGDRQPFEGDLGRPVVLAFVGVDPAVRQPPHGDQLDPGDGGEGGDDEGDAARPWRRPPAGRGRRSARTVGGPGRLRRSLERRRASCRAPRHPAHVVELGDHGDDLPQRQRDDPERRDPVQPAAPPAGGRTRWSRPTRRCPRRPLASRPVRCGGGSARRAGWRSGAGCPRRCVRSPVARSGSR